jgi:hypothetical protein
MSFTVPLPPRTQLYNRSCSNKHTPSDGGLWDVSARGWGLFCTSRWQHPCGQGIARYCKVLPGGYLPEFILPPTVRSSYHRRQGSSPHSRQARVTRSGLTAGALGPSKVSLNTNKSSSSSSSSSSAPQCEKKGYPEGVFPTIKV